MRVVVTGATGYIGGRLAIELAGEGHDVSVIVRESSDVSALQSSIPGIAVFRLGGEMGDLVSWMSDTSAQIVMHLAADQDRTGRPEAARPLVEANVGLTTELAAAAAAAGVVGFINTGSFSQHLEGTADYSPATLYAATKQAAAAILEYYRQATPMTCTTLQLTDVYGPDDTRPKVLNMLLEASESGERLAMSPGEQLLDFVHVDDVVRAFTSVAEGMLAGTEYAPVHSIGSGRTLTLREAATLWQQVTGRTVEIEWGGRDYTPRQIMKPYLHAFPTDWEPTISPEAGFASVYGKPEE